jgi:hypothetical protein
VCEEGNRDSCEKLVPGEVAGRGVGTSHWSRRSESSARQFSVALWRMFVQGTICPSKSCLLISFPSCAHFSTSGLRPHSVHHTGVSEILRVPTIVRER